MNRKEFRKLTEKKIVVLDGSSGVALQKRGMPKGVCPEQWAADNPELLIGLQKQYIEAGSDIIYTFTLGGTSSKLSEFHLSEKAYDLNKQLAQISKKAAGKKALVAGDIGPAGHLPEPFGEIVFERQVEIYKEQVRGLLDGGVDLFIIETMIDIQDARAALLAVKETCSLPVIVSMTYDRDKRTLTGSDPVSASITLQSLGADAIGANCSTGPAEMVEVIKDIKPFLNVPLIAKPNAGLPKLVDGKTVFDMDAPSFCVFTKPFVDAGVNLIGGCCGTSPDYIKGIKEQVKGLKPAHPVKERFASLTSARKTVFPGKELILVGERINPTGKLKLQEELKEGKEGEIRRLALEQAEKGASVLDVNTGTPGVDEKSAMVSAIKLLSTIAEQPLCIDSSSPGVIEAALRIYPGRALINSISGEKEKLQKLLPLAAKYGAMFILLPIDDNGIPETAEKRFKVIKEVIKKAGKAGITKESVAADGLVMTVSSDPQAAIKVTELVTKCSKEPGINTIAGLSNISFGLPQRKIINSTFLNLARESGLSMVIANPSMDMGVRDKYAEELLMGRDPNAEKYIKAYSESATGNRQPAIENPMKAEEIYDAVVKGARENIIPLIDKALKTGEKAHEIVDNRLIPAINHVGDLFEKRKYFLPQLIQSAEVMKTAFRHVEPLLRKKEGEGSKSRVIVIATVKGDIHDIGKNIVGLLLKNYGYNVYDLGKDVETDTIIKKAAETKAAVIGLSALMTTTMTEMKKVIAKAKEAGLESKIIIGGAVVNKSYADEIGADGFAKDAYEAVKLVKEILD